VMPQMSDPLEQPIHSTSNTVTESCEKLKPSHKSLKSVGPMPPCENGSVVTGKGQTYSNGLVVTANSGAQSHGKNRSNRYVLDSVFLVFLHFSGELRLFRD